MNNGFLFLSLGALFIGFTKINDPDLLGSVPFIFFFVLFRVKMWLDDAVYFSETQRQSWWFDLGVILAIFAWSSWAIAGYTIFDQSKSSGYLISSIFLLTLWILTAAAHRGKFSEHGGMHIFVNFLYMGVLLLMTCDSCRLPVGRITLSLVLVVGTIMDVLITGSMKKFVET